MFLDKCPYNILKDPTSLRCRLVFKIVLIDLLSNLRPQLYELRPNSNNLPMPVEHKFTLYNIIILRIFDLRWVNNTLTYAMFSC